jgi:hypothetical protein
VALSTNWLTKTFSVPQADLLLIGGTLYELNTETGFRQLVNAIMASEEGIVFEDPILHNTQVTVAGTTFARTIEMINGYKIEFSPDSQYSVRYIGSNNNLFDVENSILVQNQVQVISNNSGGLIVGLGSGLSASEKTQLTLIADIAEGDEEVRPGTYRVLQKTTKAELKSKTVTPTQSRTIDLKE